MRIVKTTLVVAWFVSLAVSLICVFLHITAGRQVASDLIIGIVGGTWCLTTGLLWLVEISSKGGSVVLGICVSIGPCALGVVMLSGGGLLPDLFRLWAGGVFLAWFALMFLGFWMVKFAVAREERKNNQENALPRREDNGRTAGDLALILMLFGVITVLAVIKCLVFGPPPYSPLAYVIGPCLIVAGYLVDRNAIRYLLNDCRKPPEPPAAKGG